MAKRIILAVAGAGKTYHICHMIDPKKKNLILAFTHENIHNIVNELIHAHKCVPELTTVMTFDAFVYRFLVCPYEPTIGRHFGHEEFVSKGITTRDPPPKNIKGKNGGTYANPAYKGKESLEHYINKSGQYYCATLSELVMTVKKDLRRLIKCAAEGINSFFDQVLIDEFQDFREHDFDLIVGLAKNIKDIVLVGDYYQHSVSGTNNTGKPFKCRKDDVSYHEFVQNMKNAGFVVDEKELKKSRRCSPDICNFTKEKLGIDIESEGINQGTVHWVEEDSIEHILMESSIVKLTFQDAGKYAFTSINWGYSKGDTFDSACVILTENFEKMDSESFTTVGISNSTINKLYVAMTRTKGDLFLVKASLFKKYRTNYKLNVLNN